MDVHAYLDRINYHGNLAPSAETLRQLQVAHLLTVPFENLSIHAREPIVLKDEALIEIEERWLADVGFGDSFVEPLLLDERDAQVQGDRAYRIVADDERLVVQRADNSSEWKAQYRFTLKPFQYSDYAEMCEYHQTSPLSHFTQARICSRLTPKGRVTLSDMRLITTEGGERHEHAVATQEEYAELLHKHFDIVMR